MAGLKCLILAALPMMLLAGVAQGRMLKGATTSLTKEDIDALIGVWELEEAVGVDLDAADAAFAKEVARVDGDPVTYDWKKVNAEAFATPDALSTEASRVIIAGIDTDTGLFFGYTVRSGGGLTKSAGTVEKRSDGSVYLAYITDDSTATSFRHLVDGKLHIAFMQGIDGEGSDDGVVRHSDWKKVEDPEAQAAVYKEVAALLAGEEVEGAVEDVTADKEAAEDGDMMDGDMADGDTMEGDTMEGDMADGDVMEGGGMGEEKDEKEA